MIWDDPACFIRSKVNAAIYQETSEPFLLPSADKLYGDASFLFQQDLASAHSAKAKPNATVLDQLANLPDLNPIENLLGLVKRKMRKT